MYGKRFLTLLMARNFCGKKCLDIKNVREAISDTFDGQKFLVGKSVLTSKMYGKRFPTLLMARNFCGKKCLDIKNVREAISDTYGIQKC